MPRRYNGPPNSGNGGWSAGALAASLPGARDKAITVQLKAPPPLDTPMPIMETATGAVATHLGKPVLEASYAEHDPEPVPAVTVAEAAAAEARYDGLKEHPFPTCFACGTDRRSDDGLRIFAGKIDEGRVAATWTPYDVTLPITWAALDCPSAWASDIGGRTIVLGSITARVHRMPETSERYVITAEVRRSEGRKTFTAASVHAPDGALVAAAEHVWITVDPRTFA